MIELRCKPPVQMQLLFAQESTPGKRGEMPKPRVDGLSDLVDERSSQDDEEDVGFDE